MSWADPANHVYTVGELVTPATLNTYVRDNLTDLHRRTSPAQAYISTVETAALAGVWSDLATVGPQVSVDIGQTGRAMVSISASMSCTTTAGAYVEVGYALSGANTRAPDGTKAVGFNVPNANNYFLNGVTVLDIELLPGVTTFTLKYRINVGTGSWGSRRVTVQPLGS